MKNMPYHLERLPYHLEIERMFDSVSWLERERNPTLGKLGKKMREHLRKIKDIFNLESKPKKDFHATK